jgi:hypothetical protein
MIKLKATRWTGHVTHTEILAHILVKKSQVRTSPETQRHMWKSNIKTRKGKMFSLCLTKHHAVKVYGGMMIQLHVFLTSELDGSECSASRPSRFTSKERTDGTHYIRGWVGPRASLDAVANRKIPSPCQESNFHFPDYAARSQSPYRLSYLGSPIILKQTLREISCEDTKWIKMDQGGVKRRTPVKCLSSW